MQNIASIQHARIVQAPTGRPKIATGRGGTGSCAASTLQQRHRAKARKIKGYTFCSHFKFQHQTILDILLSNWSGGQG